MALHHDPGGSPRRSLSRQSPACPPRSLCAKQTVLWRSSPTLACKFSLARQTGSALNLVFVVGAAIVEADKLMNFTRFPAARALH